MVTFVCYHCDQTLKKNQVEKHTRCRPPAFICIDCSTTFHGSDHKAHTSCISEQDKHWGEFAKKPQQKSQAAQKKQEEPKVVEVELQDNKMVEEEAVVNSWMWKNQIKRSIKSRKNRMVEYEALKAEVVGNYLNSGDAEMTKEEAGDVFDQKVKKLSKVKLTTFVQLL